MKSNLAIKIVFAIGFMSSISLVSAQGTSSANPAAEDNILALNKAMMPIYENELSKFQSNWLNTHSVIVARFDGAGGHFTLYRPRKDPIVASEAPLIYQMSKSVGHSAMITYDMSAPYFDAADNSVWKPQMQGFQDKIATALSTLDKVEIASSDRETLRSTLTIINDYLIKCISQNKVTKGDLDAYALKIRPYLPKLIKISATAQVQHDMAIIAGWKKLLGKEWKNTYALTNTMLVTRQNNLIFSMLAEFMGKSAINHRLYLFETTTFEETDKHLLNLLVRSISDEEMGAAMLGNYYAMNTELLSNGGRQIIIDEAKKYNLPDILPSEEPWDSTDWPWRHNPKSGHWAPDIGQ